MFVEAIGMNCLRMGSLRGSFQSIRLRTCGVNLLEERGEKSRGKGKENGKKR